MSQYFLYFCLLIAGALSGAGISRTLAKKRRTTPMGENEQGTEQVKYIPPYLANNSWEQELNFKLWTTKGARFQADMRSSHLDRLSQVSTAFLTAYVIILGLMPYFLKAQLDSAVGDIVNYANSSISIILLAYALLESFHEYNLQAHLYHECGLAVSKLYNRLRQAKEISDGPEKTQIIHQIADEYEETLGRYDNHEFIDWEMFQTTKSPYFGLSPLKVRWIHAKYFWKVRFRHYMIVFAPPLLICWLLYYSFTHKQAVTH